MIGLELLSAGLLHVMPLNVIPIVSQIECSPKKQLSVHVVSAQNDARYDFSKKTAELNQIGKGAYSPYGGNHHNIEVRGLTSGQPSFTHNIEFYFEKYDSEGLACLQIENVTVTINYNPTVYVSTKFEEGTPIFHKILEHEKEHVHITQRIIEKYKPILKQQLENQLSQNFSTGPFSIDHFQKEKQKFENTVGRIIAKAYREMDKESQQKHNQFDDSELNETIQYNQGIARQLEMILNLNN